ncbi:MAG: GNAT family N-acetyltransferase [Desulfobacterales bacterium]|nr:GNAT family N-acetyltransferase [Desulfobacterales bacterium]
MIRRALASDAVILTELSFASKRYWGYPDAYFDRWSPELTIDGDYICNNDVFVYEINRTIVGYYAIVELREDVMVSGVKLVKGFWLEHMFVAPRHIGRGIGRQLFNHLRQRCRARGIDALGILADPNARGFYARMGCEYVGEYPSTIEDRTTPFLRLVAANEEPT